MHTTLLQPPVSLPSRVSHSSMYSSTPFSPRKSGRYPYASKVLQPPSTPSKSYSQPCHEACHKASLVSRSTNTRHHRTVRPCDVQNHHRTRWLVLQPNSSPQNLTVLLPAYLCPLGCSVIRSWSSWPYDGKRWRMGSTLDHFYVEEVMSIFQGVIESRLKLPTYDQPQKAKDRRCK